MMNAPDFELAEFFNVLIFADVVVDLEPQR
jgi:hypothetical protein